MSTSHSKRWQDDSAFVGWLVQQNYAQINGSIEVKPFLTLGMLLYMHEAYQEGKTQKLRLFSD